MSQYPAWSKPEADYLNHLAGDLPFPELVARYQDEAQQQGWPARSANAILQRLRRTGQKGHVRQGAWLTTGGVAELLGCNCSRVEAWFHIESIVRILQPRRHGHFNYTHRNAWVRLARERPMVLGGISAERLFLLLEDRELANHVARTYRHPLGDYRVRCVETGQVWPSAAAAARQLHVHHTTITLSIRQRRPVASLGLRFEALRNAADPSQPLRFRNRTA